MMRRCMRATSQALMIVFLGLLETIDAVADLKSHEVDLAVMKIIDEQMTGGHLLNSMCNAHCISCVHTA